MVAPEWYSYGVLVCYPIVERKKLFERQICTFRGLKKVWNNSGDYVNAKGSWRQVNIQEWENDHSKNWRCYGVLTKHPKVIGNKVSLQECRTRC